MFILLFLIIVIIILAYFFLSNMITNKNKINNPQIFTDSFSNYHDSIPESKIFDDIVPKKNLNKIKFHEDYKDVISFIDFYNAKKKKKFNENNLPYHFAPIHENIVEDFIPDLLLFINNGSNKFSHRSNINNKSGWDKAQENLGLPTSLYDKPSSHSKLIFIKIKKITRIDTDSEAKYIIYLILQKINSDDQIFLNIHFYLRKKDYSKNKNIIIENIFIIGFLTNDEVVENQEYSEYLSDTNSIKSKIDELLLEKQQNILEEIDYHNNLLDSENNITGQIS